MLYIGTPSIAVAVVALTLGVLAGELDPLQLQQAFDAGLLARQDDPNANLNIFTGALGGVTAPPITPSTDTNHPYSIKGENVTHFKDDAINKACNIQKNDCSNLANGALRDEFSVSQCDDQFVACKSTLEVSATQTAFLSRVTEAGNDEYDFLCEN